MLFTTFIVCLAFFPSWSSTTTIDEKAGILDEGLKALRKMTTGTGDPFASLKDFGQDIGKFMRATSSIYAIAEKNPPPGSDEYKMLNAFNTQVSEIMKKMDGDDEYDFYTGLKASFKEYETEVTLPIEKMKNYTDMIVDPEIKKTESDLRNYRRACTSAREGFLNEDGASMLKNNFSTYEEASKAFFDEILLGRGNKDIWDLATGDRCYIRELMVRTTFNHRRIDSFVKKLKNQLKDLEYIHENCAKVYATGIYPNFPANIILVLLYTPKWIDESMSAAWPVIHNHIFHDQIRNLVKQPENFDRKMLKKASELTSSILNNTGITNYKYEMLIVKAPKKNFQFHFANLTNNFYFDEGDFGFNTILVRRPFNYSNRMDQWNLEKKMRRLADYADELKINITYEMKDLYDSAKIADIAEGLKNKLGSFVSKNGFQGFAIARKWEKTPFKACSAIDDVQFSYDSFSAIYNFTYQNSGNMLQHCETFNFYFFS
ncbi:hypothetical protein CAEBREN_09703 [Caenorhabditis brenneri]|uniref:Domain of unknown function WSN domain-containing protein n=1 Tax=Caenorhabditis brenneri TaxID=135651 RepID=G0MF38_CAEBE|nr:hypothetical protein CAEBREN_09703 [Caenorhabditis brenneri]